MNVTYPCPQCETANRAEIDPPTELLKCRQCGREMQLPPGAIENGKITRCLACPSTDLFVRKDFPQGLGVTIVTIGLLASCVAWGYGQLYWTFGILCATALIDLILYIVVPNALMCYRCGAMYRGIAAMDAYSSFNLETHERYRQQKIRLEEAKRTAEKRVQDSGFRVQEENS